MLAILQFDSVSLSVLERLLAEGRLPALAELRARGRWQPLDSPGRYFAPSVYPTLYSGIEAGDHGFYYPFQWDAAAQRVRLAASFGIPASVWDRISAAGRRSLVIDPYEASPPRSEAGVILSGWQFVNRVVLKGWSRPAGARRELAGRFGAPSRVEEVFGRPTLARLEGLRRLLDRAPARAVDAAGHFLGAGSFDLLWVAFPPAHLAGHQFWDLSQLQERDREEARASGLDLALEDLYGQVDAAIGRIVALLPPDTDILVVSPLGMEANRSRVELLPPMLAAVLSGDTTAARNGGGADQLLWRLRSALPTDLRASVARVLPDRVALELTARLETRGVDWSQTRAFAVPGDLNGHVRVNLRGRERDGIVEESELDGLLEEIAEGLLTFENLDGSRTVQRVERVSALLGGRRTDLLPDLIVSWGDQPLDPQAGIRSARFGEIPSAGAGSGRSGNHTDDAWALLVPGASSVRTPSRPARLTDVAATVCELLGGDPTGLGGEPLLEA